MDDIKKNILLESIKGSHFIKVVLIGFLVLLLQIPIAKIRGVIEEREQTRAEAVDEVTNKWGRSQSLIGPAIIVPYKSGSVQQDNRRQRQYQSDIEYASFLPELLKISGRIKSELRYRGIFKIPVYKMYVDISGNFSRPDFTEWTIDPNDILWDRAFLSIRVADAQALTKSTILSWNNKPLDFLPSAGVHGSNPQGIHVKLKDNLDSERYDFSFSMELNGSVGAYFVPFGRDTEVDISSNWGSPSFQGTWLPTERTVNDEGFKATWNIPFLSTNYPKNWKSWSDLERAASSSLFGVDMISPIDHYRMSHRSVKYQILFLVLTFATLWLFEVLIKINIHPVQYLFIGVGMCLFYLLELSLAEHTGFVLAYVIASVAIVILITSYCAAVLKTAKRAMIVGLVVMLLYIYLYVLLMIEDYALLFGSIGLFVALAIIMFLTRKVDWYSLTNIDILKTAVDNKES
jgi:inner membrane protein